MVSGSFCVSCPIPALFRWVRVFFSGNSCVGYDFEALALLKRCSSYRFWEASQLVWGSSFGALGVRRSPKLHTTSIRKLFTLRDAADTVDYFRGRRGGMAPAVVVSGVAVVTPKPFVASFFASHDTY